MQVTGIGWAGVLTEDFESTLRFFSGVMGLPVAYRDEKKELVHFRFRSGQLFEVYGPSNRRRKEKYQWFDGPVLGFEVDNVESTRREMSDRGVRFITELESWENDTWTLFLGPENKLFEILRPTRRPASRPGSLSGICCASVFVQDFETAMQFFTQVMEMPLARPNDGQKAAHCWLSAGQLFELFRRGENRDRLTSHTTIGFEVEDVKRTRYELQTVGVEFLDSIESMENGWVRSHFWGPDGFIYDLVGDDKHRSDKTTFSWQV